VSASKKLTVLERMNPVREILYDPDGNPGGPILVVVKPLRASRVPDFLDLMEKSGAELLLGKWKEMVREFKPVLLAMVDECCTIPEDLSVKAEDYPVKLMEQCFDAILDMNFAGNWRALGIKAGLIRPQSQLLQTTSETASAK
jgi:hypothetical protein